MLTLGLRVSLPVIANKPQNDVEYMANIVPCDAEFNGNYTPPFERFTAGTQSMKPYRHAIVLIVLLTSVHILL